MRLLAPGPSPALTADMERLVSASSLLSLSLSSGCLAPAHPPRARRARCARLRTLFICCSSVADSSSCCIALVCQPLPPSSLCCGYCRWQQRRGRSSAFPAVCYRCCCCCRPPPHPPTALFVGTLPTSRHPLPVCFLPPLLWRAWASEAALLRWGDWNWPSGKPRGLSPTPTASAATAGLVLAAVTGRAEIRSRVSPLRLFLAACPHGLLCLDTLTTGSCEGATLWPAASVRVSCNFSRASLCLCRCFPST